MKTAAAFALFVVFFWIADRGAYKGYFDGDDLDNINMTNSFGTDMLVTKMVSPKLDESNFRPVGHGFYRYFSRYAKLSYPKYVAFIQILHIVNVILLWLVLRALGFDGITAALGLLLFAFNMGTFEIYWKPMYVFDLFCATFTLATILLWIEGRWLLALLTFWLAFKSKEVAVALPVVLALLEWNLGKRRWKQLIPFFAISLCFGIQAILGNRGRDNAYTFRFTWLALQQCVAFYGNKILVIPFGAILVAALFLVRDRWARFGVVAVLLFMGPMFFLPGRLFGAYLYVPLIGLAIAGAALGRKIRPIAAVVLMLVWLPLNYREMQNRRKEFLAISDDNRKYVEQVLKFGEAHPETNTFLFDLSPEGLHSWGVRAAARYAVLPRPEPKEAEIRTPEALPLLKEPNLAYLKWIPVIHELKIVSRDRQTKDRPYIVMDLDTPIWQLGDGWHGLEGKFQWTNLTADAHVARPPGAKRFEVLVNVGAELIGALHKVKFEVLVDGVKIGEQEFSKPGWTTVAYDVPPSTESTAQVQFKASPGFFYEDHNPADALGIGIGAFGFPTTEYPAVEYKANQ